MTKNEQQQPEEEENVQVCPDNHRCENGSICIEDSTAEGKYFCDCEESSLLDGATVFSGLYCQHEATVYCTLTGKMSKTSFCTNQGTCLGKVGENGGEHMGCECPKGYTGRHCQFIEGSEGPESSFVQQNNAPALTMTDVNNTEQQRGGDGTGMGTPGLVLIILLAISVLSAILVVAVRRQRQHAETHVIETTKSSDGHLPDADGSTLEVAPTKSFSIDGEHDDVGIQTVDSGHLA